jgi:hypothetical protein
MGRPEKNSGGFCLIVARSVCDKEEGMKSLLLGILMIIAIPIPLRGQTVSAPPDTSHVFSLVFSSNLHGQVEPCG